MKPQLPYEIRMLFPKEIVHEIMLYVAHEEKQSPKTPSPSLQRELYKIQTMRLNGKSPTYMIEFDEFCLD